MLMFSRQLALFALIFATPLALLAAGAAPNAEANFEQRLRTANAAKTLDAYAPLYDFDGTPVEMQRELLKIWGKVHGLEIVSIQFTELDDAIQRAMSQIITIQGKQYVVNLAPTRMVKTTYRLNAQSESVVHSFAIGLKDGQYYCPGLKPKM